METKKVSRICFLLLAGSFLCQQAHAYFDPGNGGYLFAALWGYLAGIFGFILTAAGFFFRKIISVTLKKHKIAVVLLLGCLAIGAVFWMSYHRMSGHPDERTKAISLVYKPGVFIFDPKQSYKGYNFIEGDLYDMTGKLLHSWRRSGFVGSYGVIDRNGDLYASSKFEEGKWGRYDWQGNTIWEKDYVIHHDIVVYGEKVIVFTKEKQKYKGRNVAFDVIVTLDKNGKELDRWRLWDAKEHLRKYHAPVLLDVPFVPIRKPEKSDSELMDLASYDYYHLNSLQILPSNAREKDSNAFREGNWLVSFRGMNMIAILDQDTKQVLWSISSRDVPVHLDSQHSPRMLSNGNIVVFDNGSKRKWSRVIEIDPAARKIVWEYKQDNFYSRIMGYVQPLPNGNVLITESSKWRVLEVTKDKEIVWEFYNRTPQPLNSMKDNFRMIRYPPEYIEPILRMNGHEI